MKKIGIIFTVVLFCFINKRIQAQQLFSLEECIDYALINNTDISRANNRVESEKSYLEQSKAAQGATLSFLGNQNFSSVNNYQVDENEGNWNRDLNSGMGLSLNTSITLYNGAKLKNTIKQNKVNLVAAETDIQTEEEILSLDILAAYIGVLLAKENLKNKETQLESIEKQLEYSRVRKDAGVISTSDLLNIKSQYAAEKAFLIDGQNNYRISLVALMQKMNMPINDSFNIAEPFIEDLINDTHETDAALIYNIAVGIQPSVKSAELNVKGAQTQIQIAKADGLPKLSLNGSLGTGYNNNLYDISFSEQLTKGFQPSLGLSLSIPIFQQKQVKNNVTQATIQFNNYQLDFTDIKNDLRKYIELACTNAQTAYINYQALLEQFKAEKEAHNLAEEMFSQGMINSVDYLTLKNNMLTAESNLTQAKYNVLYKNKIIDYYMGETILF